MKIVIPMSGAGDRFRRAGYRQPKPLIPVDGRPMIERVIEMFPGEASFVFICNADHLQQSPLEAVLRRAKPGAAIIPIAPHKLGPVYAACQALHHLNDDEEVIVNYCDFGVCWDYGDFLNQVRRRRADGAISAYRGFHPHSLGPTYYAYMRHEDNWLEEIREKSSFTDNRMNEYASAGTYYFARGELVKKYFPRAIEEKLEVGGEFYVSLVYNLLHRDGYRIFIYELRHFLQWGTPQDLEEYQYWSDCFRGPEPRAAGRGIPSGTTYNLMVMAGRGMRFAREGFAVPKMLVPIAGEPMVIQAIRCLPPARRWGFVCLREHVEAYPIHESLVSEVGDCDLLVIDGVTEGQACTALLAQALIDPDEPLLVAACDNGMRWDATAYEQLLADGCIDGIIWTFRGRTSLEQNPQAFGWVEVEGIRARRVSAKAPISATPRRDHAIVGTFFFRKSQDFVRAAGAMIDADRRVKGEFYIDEAINVLLAEGKKVVVFEVSAYLGWGTPDDVRTFHYWREHFHEMSPGSDRKPRA